MSQPPGPPPPGYGPPPPGASPGRTLPLVVGALLGGIDLVVTTLLGIGVGSGIGNTFYLSFLGPIVGLAIPVVLLFNVATRWWGVGMLIGYFLTLIVLGGACAVILMSLGS